MMTDAQFVKSFMQMIIGLIVLTLILIALGVVIGGAMDDKLQAQTEEFSQRIVAQRTQPEGNLNVGEIETETMSVAAVGTEPSSAGGGDAGGVAVADLHPGQVAYQKSCYICHDVGLTGAPKPGESENWGPRIAQGIEVLYDRAINGFQGQRGVMPPKGGNPTLSDEEVMAAVDWLVETVQ